MIQREHYIEQVRPFYESDLIKIITGIRRCGKSVIMEQIIKEIAEKTDNIIYLNFEDKKVVYQELYNFKQNYQTFVYKQPVYEEEKIVGLFKITLARTEWTEQVKSSTTIIIACSISFLLLLYCVIIYFLNREDQEEVSLDQVENKKQEK